MLTLLRRRIGHPTRVRRGLASRPASGSRARRYHL